MNAHKDGCYLDEGHRGYCRQRPKPDLYVRGLDPDLARKRHAATTPQPDPRPSAHPEIWHLVLVDMHERNESGRRKYGTALKPFNGRDPLVDAYQEALDLVVYLRQAIYERGRCDDCGMDRGLHDMAVEH